MKIIILGAGQVGGTLAQNLASEANDITVVDSNEAKLESLRDRLDISTVIGFGSHPDTLVDAGIRDADMLIAVTNNDETNIMSSMLAKRMGAARVMALVSNPAYVDLVQGSEVDIAISPQQATIGSLLTHIRRGDVVNVHSLRRGAAEALEAIAHGDKNNSKVVGRKIGEIALPAGTTIGAILRGDKVLIAHDNVVVETGDHVILFLMDKSRIPEVERLFQVGFTFF